MVIYVPGTDETDPKKQNMSLQALGAATATNTTNIAANTAAIAALTAPPAATQADQETATSTTAFVSPGRQQFHPSSVKAWGYVTVSAGVYTLGPSYNASISKIGTGNITITFTTPFSGAGVYAVSAVSDSRGFAATAFPVSASAATVRITDFSSTDSDRGFSFMAFGDQ